jgi:V8-like Glu-specific endopeptidase
MNKAKTEKTMTYREIKTSPGQSGSPIIIKHKHGF